MKLKADCSDPALLPTKQHVCMVITYHHPYRLDRHRLCKLLGPQSWVGCPLLILDSFVYY